MTPSPDAIPDVSVLIPVRNGARYLDLALESLAAQTLDNFEIVVVDNRSTDATPELLAAWGEREPRLRVLRCDANLARSLNRAAEIARADLLARLDADDIVHPRRLETQVAAMKARPALGLLGSAVDLIDADGRKIGTVRPPLGDEALRRLQRASSGIVPSSAILRAEPFRRAGGYRDGLNISEDFDLWTRMSEICEIGNLPEVLTFYRLHDESLTARQPIRMALASLCVSAAAVARAANAPEPFVRGCPRLRTALELLDMPRSTASRIIRLRSAVNLLSRRLRRLPVPAFVRRRSGAWRHWGFNTLYRRWLGFAHRPRRACPVETV